jgi:hypothetical protein
MAVVSHEHGFLFVMAPRTGSTALGTLLCEQLGGSWVPPEDILDDEGMILVQRKHSTVAHLVDNGIVPRERARELFKFTAVRNPFDSLVSLWVKKRTSYQSLLDEEDSFVNRLPGFAQDMEFVLTHTFTEWIAREYRLLDDRRPRHLYSTYVNSVDHIMRFEHLQRDFDEVVTEHLGLDRTFEVPLHNVTRGRGRDYRDYYTLTSRRTVERVFAADLERFGYRF